MSFEIVTDTSANLSLAYSNKNRLSVVPFSYITADGEHQCFDPEAFEADEYYTAIKCGMKVSTSQVTPKQYIDCFTPLLSAGKDILFVGMSSGISGSFLSACIATDELRSLFPDRKIELIDTFSASLAEGILVIRAVDYRAEGMSLEETADKLRVLRKQMCQIFTVDDLMHLRRGGRLSNLSAIVGTVLNIKPLLKGDPQGKIVAFQKVRGRKNSIKAIAEHYDQLVREPEAQVVGISHAGCTEDANALAELIRQNNPPKEILIAKYEPVTGAHVGPGALALFFLGDENVRNEI